ncbi:MAG: phosphatase PAP2 family protein [Chitinophagaceae bacterium]|nr:phosphatase PAP2 family protein [Chitinophagaceae bacterium]
MATSLEKGVHNYFLEHDAFFNTKIDSYFKWLPIAATFTAHLCQVRTRDAWIKQLLIAGASEGIRYFVTDSLKNVSSEKRPLPYFDHRSFPSGHTSSSFAAAYFMRQELKQNMPALSYAGYLCAVSAAVIRLMKSKHWLKDVVAGAAIGVISAKLAFMIVDKLSSKAKASLHQAHHDIN